MVVVDRDAVRLSVEFIGVVIEDSYIDSSAMIVSESS